MSCCWENEIVIFADLQVTKIPDDLVFRNVISKTVSCLRINIYAIHYRGGILGQLLYRWFHIFLTNYSYSAVDSAQSFAWPGWSKIDKQQKFAKDKDTPRSYAIFDYLISCMCILDVFNVSFSPSRRGEFSPLRVFDLQESRYVSLHLKIQHHQGVGNGQGWSWIFKV